MSFAALSIQSLHILTVVFFTFAPYVDDSDELLVADTCTFLNRIPKLRDMRVLDFFYVVSASALLLHWWMNSDVCVLTQIEAWIRGSQKASTSFLKKLIQPIYIINDQTVKRLSYSVVLWNLTYIFFFKPKASNKLQSWQTPEPQPSLTH